MPVFRQQTKTRNDSSTNFESLPKTCDEPEIRAYTDIISGTETQRGEEYQRLHVDIEDGALDVVVVHELSRLSRLGAGEIHEFLEFCLSHETGVQDLEVGLDISLEDDLVDRAVSQLIAGVMGDLARVEHKQKLRQIQSGIEAGELSHPTQPLTRLR